MSGDIAHGHSHKDGNHQHDDDNNLTCNEDNKRIGDNDDHHGYHDHLHTDSHNNENLVMDIVVQPAIDESFIKQSSSEHTKNSKKKKKQRSIYLLKIGKVKLLL